MKESAKKEKKVEKPPAKMFTPKKLPPQKPAKKAPVRATRATRGKKERDIMDVPSDSDE